MSKIISTVRATLIALAVASPALAQTPRDLANLAFQQNVPSYVSAAPTQSGHAGAASATDIARLLQTDLSGTVSSAPASNGVFATSFGAQDVARLSGSAAQPLFEIRTNGITLAEATHN